MLLIQRHITSLHVPDSILSSSLRPLSTLSHACSHQNPIQNPINTLSPPELKTLVLAQFTRGKFSNLIQNVVASSPVLLTACRNLKAPCADDGSNSPSPSLLDSVSTRFSLEQLARQLRENQFDIESSCLTISPSTKNGGSLVVPNLKLKVVIEAIRMVLEVIYDDRFATFAYGGRVNMGRHTAIRPELYKSRVLELNASDDRGINVVRTKIKDFAAVAVGSGQRSGGYPCPPYKIIILDEADSMTEDAQNALRRTMETYSKVTRFFFICNYISRIIEPLASRCAKFRFKPLSAEIMSNRVLHICKEEGLSLDSEALSSLSSVSQGDLRRAITYLQGAARLFGSSISAKDLISVSGVIPAEIVQDLFAACRSGNFDLANKKVNNCISEGYPVSQMLSQLFEVAVEADDISDEQKARICKRLAEADKHLVDGADEYLQLLDVASCTMRALCNMPEKFSYEN